MMSTITIADPNVLHTLNKDFKRIEMTLQSLRKRIVQEGGSISAEDMVWTSEEMLPNPLEWNDFSKDVMTVADYNESKFAMQKTFRYTVSDPQRGTSERILLESRELEKPIILCSGGRVIAFLVPNVEDLRASDDICYYAGILHGEAMVTEANSGKSFLLRTI